MPLEQPQDRRGQTRAAVYRHIYEATGFCSRQSLAYDLHLSLPTVYKDLAELMEAGLIASSGEQMSTGGRKSTGLTAIDDARYALGISLSGDMVRIVAADLRLREIASRDVGRASASAAGLGGLLAQAVDGFLDENGLDRSRLLGVGIALAAAVTPDGGIVAQGPGGAVQGAGFQSLGAQIPYPVRFANDAACGAAAEQFVRRSKGSMAYLSLGDRVDGAAVLNGSLFPGESAQAASFAHLCVEPGGAVCQCGKHGCLEAYCSIKRIGEDLGMTPEDFFGLVAQRSQLHVAKWYDLLRHLAMGANSIRMILDCDVVLGGPLAGYMEKWMPLLRQYAAACNSFGDGADYLKLGALGARAVPLGAALQFIAPFLDHV